MFVYSGGKLVAEYSTADAPGASTKYVATDTLGSIRAISDQNGNIVSRRDFMPFGEELYAGTPNRTSTQGYSTNDDDIKQKFTGYERDKETGLDFAEARMYKNQHGRFTAIDPLLASGRSINPQTFNKYVYVANSPFKFTDPLGLDWVRLEGEVFYDNNVIDKESAVALYGKNAVYLPVGYMYVASTGEKVVLGKYGFLKKTENLVITEIGHKKQKNTAIF